MFELISQKATIFCEQQTIQYHWEILRASDLLDHRQGKLKEFRNCCFHSIMFALDFSLKFSQRGYEFIVETRKKKNSITCVLNLVQN